MSYDDLPLEQQRPDELILYDGAAFKGHFKIDGGSKCKIYELPKSFSVTKVINMIKKSHKDG